MPIHRDKLVFAALCVVDEAVEQTRKGPIVPTLGVRFALSYLWAVGSGEQRCHFTELLAALEGKPKNGVSPFGAANSCMWAIKRHVGHPLTPEADSALSNSWLSRP